MVDGWRIRDKYNCTSYLYNTSTKWRWSGIRVDTYKRKDVWRVQMYLNCWVKAVSDKLSNFLSSLRYSQITKFAKNITTDSLYLDAFQPVTVNTLVEDSVKSWLNSAKVMNDFSKVVREVAASRLYVKLVITAAGDSEHFIVLVVKLFMKVAYIRAEAKSQQLRELKSKIGKSWSYNVATKQSPWTSTGGHLWRLWQK